MTQTDSQNGELVFTQSLSDAYAVFTKTESIQSKIAQYRLINAFYMQSQQFEPHWQFGFFCDETQKITSFVVNEQAVSENNADDAMKEPDAAVLTLDMAQIQISETEAYATALTLAQIEYKGAVPQVKIFLLQHDTQLGHVWNITFVTQDYQVLNIKIAAQTGVVLTHNAHSLLDMQAKQ